MRYISTRGQAPVLTFGEAMLTGLARDGGLYIPEEVTPFTQDEIAAMAGLSYEEVAFRVMWPFVEGDFTEEEFRGCIQRAYAGFDCFVRAPLVQLRPNLFLLELFHGPTLAFKDFAMQLIGQLFQTALARTGRRVTIVGATSGDTGSAAIEAFKGLANVDVFILFPDGNRVSEVQRRQMTTPAESNVHALALAGDFDDCQARLKDMFNDHVFRDEVALAGVNSINFARVLAQVVYYFTSALALGAPHRKVSFAVPTGNFGDIYAGHLARALGLPIAQLVMGTNANDILYRALSTGEYRTSTVVPTISPSMDIQVSSNFERALFEVLDRDGAAVSRLMADLGQGGFTIPQPALDRLNALFLPERVDEDLTEDTIMNTWEHDARIVCPHTAVGINAAETYLYQAGMEVPMVVLATAHPAKFPDAVEKWTTVRPALPPHMADLFDRPERVTAVPNDLPALEALVRERLAGGRKS